MPNPRGTVRTSFISFSLRTVLSVFGFRSEPVFHVFRPLRIPGKWVCRFRRGRFPLLRNHDYPQPVDKSLLPSNPARPDAAISPPAGSAVPLPLSSGSSIISLSVWTPTRWMDLLAWASATLADQFQIIDIELDGFVGGERFVVQDIKVAWMRPVLGSRRRLTRLIQRVSRSRVRARATVSCEALVAHSIEASQGAKLVVGW